MNNNIQTLIFDCDGTLVDSEVPGIDVLRALASALGLGLTQAQAHRQFRGVHMADCVRWIGAQLSEQAGNFEVEFSRKVRSAVADRFREGLDVMPGAFELLARLKVPYCVASIGPSDQVELTLGITGLLPYFEGRIFSAYDIGHFKPDPRLFLSAAKAMGVAPAQCAVVEGTTGRGRCGHAGFLPPSRCAIAC